GTQIEISRRTIPGDERTKNSEVVGDCSNPPNSIGDKQSGLDSADPLVCHQESPAERVLCADRLLEAPAIDQADRETAHHDDPARDEKRYDVEALCLRELPQLNSGILTDGIESEYVVTEVGIRDRLLGK